MENAIIRPDRTAACDTASDKWSKMSKWKSSGRETILSKIPDSAQNRGISNRGKKTSKAANGHSSQNNKRYTLPKKEARHVKMRCLPFTGKIFLHKSEVRNEKENAVRPYTHSRPSDTVMAQERRVLAMIKRPAPVNPPRGEREPQKEC
jgi:hypothetical protein